MDTDGELDRRTTRRTLVRHVTRKPAITGSNATIASIGCIPAALEYPKTITMSSAKSKTSSGSVTTVFRMIL